jgi:hypothetical protein
MPYLAPSHRIIQVVYDFAVDGGLVSSIPLRGPKVPGGALVVDVYGQLTTALAGGTVTDTVALQIESAADVQAAAARNAAPWSTTGIKRFTFVPTTTPIFTTVERSVTLVIAGTALTAGKLTVWTRYVEPIT